jgi:hypothetical protein
VIKFIWLIVILKWEREEDNEWRLSIKKNILALMKLLIIWE